MRERIALTPAGFLNIDKPLGFTSHDVVARVRRKLNLKRIGHAGTLDPLATGVLVLCLGPATRLSEYVMNATKRYQARIRLGATTTTYDAEGEITDERDITHITQDDVRRVLPRFLGEIQQLPPLYSAIKQGGRKLYEIARAGETAELSPRPVTIHALEIVDWSPPLLTLDVTCGSGTYIRSLAHDLGQALGVGGYLVGLVRTASGSFTLDTAVPLDTLLADADPRRFVIPPRAALADWPVIHPDERGLDDLRQGRALQGADHPPGMLALALAPDDSLIAVVRSADGLWKPEKVFL